MGTNSNRAPGARVDVALSELDKLVDQVRSNNGYAASFPEEQKYTVESLEAGSKTLKQDSSTSIGYLREFVFRPVGRLAKRFAGAAISAAIEAFKLALKDWLRKKGVDWLDEL